jgi:hypothetical protein
VQLRRRQLVHRAPEEIIAASSTRGTAAVRALTIAMPAIQPGIGSYKNSRTA